jgi:hypothetical protein
MDTRHDIVLDTVTTVEAKDKLLLNEINIFPVASLLVAYPGLISMRLETNATTSLGISNSVWEVSDVDG